MTKVYSPYSGIYIDPDNPPHRRETGVEKFVKGTVWRLTRPITVRGTPVPAGTTFEVVYPRRRESDMVAVKFLTQINFAKRRHHASSMPRSRTQKGRFHKADELIRADKIEAEIVSRPEGAAEYYIREIGTDRLWSGGNLSPAGFHTVPWTDANHYVSAENARIGIVTLLFRKHRHLRITDETSAWEIVGYDAHTKEVKSVHDISSIWWNNIVRLARFFHQLPEDSQEDRKSRSTKRQRVRRVANAIPIGEQRWDIIVFGEKVPAPMREKMLDKMSNAGITDFQVTHDNTFLLEHDTDRVMMKLLFAEDVETQQLV